MTTDAAGVASADHGAECAAAVYGRFEADLREAPTVEALHAVVLAVQAALSAGRLPAWAGTLYGYARGQRLIRFGVPAATPLPHEAEQTA